ncbi:extracellular solute-binding protein [Demequina sp.]|uniref:extracellular solute-binding protein n=1 Tax=Demequina sp. TaxID=2050685 RepID=UPI0025C4F6E0|nr:extracellular solute-binding protein [Demequina sp.]
MKKKTLTAVAMATAGVLALAACSSSNEPEATTSGTSEPEAVAEDITLWLMGTDTPDALIDYLKTTYADVNGGALTVEQIGWGDAISSLTTALPDASNTPDVTEVGNTQAATFTTVGAFMDISDMYDELGGDSLLQGFVEAGSVGDAKYALPYYFGSRMVWYRADLYAEAGVDVPTTLAEYTEVNKTMKDAGIAGSYTAGQDWRSGISWIFANGGDIASFDGSEWTATLSSPESIEGMQQWQELYQDTSVAQPTDNDTTTYQAINDEFLAGIPAASTMAPNWAYWSLGDLSENDEGDTVATWNEEKFGAYALPGVNGGIAPVFAGGSNIAVSATTQHEAGAKDLMRIIFSEEYQTMLAENGLGPANLDYADAYVEVAAMGEIGLAAAQAAKLTPAAPGWAAVEEAALMEQYFQAVAEGGDVPALAAEYDDKINALING